MTAILELDALEIRYRTGFGVGPAQVSCAPGLYRLTGRNGAGKTTLFRAMAGELKPHRGACRVVGEDVYQHHRARGQVAYVAASPDFPSFVTVDEAWTLMASLRGAPGWDGHSLRAQLGLDGGLLLDHASSGQRRQAELLAALAGDPTVLILDEVFTHLDTVSSAVLHGWLEELRHSRVIWISGHHAIDLPFEAHYELEAGAPLRVVN